MSTVRGMARQRSEQWPARMRHQKLRKMISSDVKSNQKGKNELNEAYASASPRPTT